MTYEQFVSRLEKTDPGTLARIEQALGVSVAFLLTRAAMRSKPKRNKKRGSIGFFTMGAGQEGRNAAALPKRMDSGPSIPYRFPTPILGLSRQTPLVVQKRAGIGIAEERKKYPHFNMPMLRHRRSVKRRLPGGGDLPVTIDLSEEEEEEISFLLQELGDFLLQETGDKIELE